MVCLLVPRSVCSLWFRRLAIIDDEEAFVSFSLAVRVLPKLQLSIKSFSGCNTMWLFIWFTITITTTNIKLQLGDYDYGSDDDDGEGDDGDDDDYPVTQKWCGINIVPICHSKSVNQQSLNRWVNNFTTSLNKWRPYKGLTSSHHESTSVIFLLFQKWN